MAINNMFSTGFSSGFGTGGTFSGGWNNNTSTSTKAPTKQQKFPGLNEQQIANIEKYTANLTGGEKSQEQQKLYQAMIQAIENQNFSDNRMAVNNERYRNSLTKTDPRECNFDQSACRQSTLVDMVKSARNLKANTPEETVMQMFMQEMDYKGIGMDKLNSYLDNGDESILFETGLKTNQGGTKDLVNQASVSSEKAWKDKSVGEKVDTVTNYANVIGLASEKLDESANNFADKFTVTGEKAAKNLASKIENMSKEEMEAYRKEFRKAVGEKKIGTAYTYGDTVVERLWNGIKGEKFYPEDEEAFMKWLIDKKVNLGQSLIGADDMLKGEHNPNVIKFFGNIPSSAVKTFTATVRGMTNPYDTMKGLYKLAATEEGHQALLNRYGSWDALADAMNTDPVGVADDVLAVAELGTNIAKGGLKFTGKVTGNQSLLNAANTIEGWNIGSANDALAQKTVGKVYGGLDKIADMSNSKTVQTVNRVIQDESNLGKMAEEGKNLYETVKNSNFVDEMINKVVGIDKEDRTFIKNNKDLVNDYISGEKNVETVYDTVQEKLSDKALEKTELGKEYDKLTQNTEKVVVTEGLTSDKDLQKLLKKGKITIDADGNLVFDKFSEYNPTQQRAIQDAWETVKNLEEAKNVDAGTALDQRRKVDDKINWEGKATNKSRVDFDAEDLIKQMRKSIDARAKQYVPGLAELDAKYQPLIEEVKQMKRDRFNPDGTIKDNARSKIRNLTKAGNEAKLERLERIAPGITQDLKALDAALTVEKLTKNSVGQYYKGGGIALGIKSLFSGNIPAAIGFTAVGILATPKNFVKLIQLEPAIAGKLMNGDTLSSADISRLQALASRIEDGMDVEE